MQFQIPQFIETEDKIVGPLSLRQFLYIAAAVGVSVLLYFMLQTWLWVILSIPIVGGAAAFSFVKINGRPLVKLVQSALFFYWSPQRYVWQPENPGLPKNEETLRSVGGGFSIEKIVSGLALKNAWQNVQVGNKESTEKAGRALTRLKEQYEVFSVISGERKAARRIDYR